MDSSDEYLKYHGIPHILNEMLELVLLNRSETPLKEMAQFLQMKSLVSYGLKSASEGIPTVLLDKPGDKLSQTLHRNDKRRLTRIVSCVGLRNDDLTLKGLLEAGINGVMLQMSTLSLDGVRRTATAIRTQSKKKSGCAVYIALKGTEIRTGHWDGVESVMIEQSKSITLFCVTPADIEQRKSSPVKLYVDHYNLPRLVQKGSLLLVDEGQLHLTVTSISGQEITCNPINSHQLGSRKTVTAPRTEMEFPVLTPSDSEAISLAGELKVTAIAASIRSSKQLTEVRHSLGSHGREIEIILRVDTFETVDNIEDILPGCDGMIVDRKGLAIHYTPSRLLSVQRALQQKCKAWGKYFYVQHGILESMKASPFPSPNESCQLASLTDDKVDGVILTGEVENGKHAVSCITTCSSICVDSEVAQYTTPVCFPRNSAVAGWPSLGVDSTVSALLMAASVSHAECLLVITNSLTILRALASRGPAIPIFMASLDANTLGSAVTWRGVFPVLLPQAILKYSASEVIHDTIGAISSKGGIHPSSCAAVCYSQDLNAQSDEHSICFFDINSAKPSSLSVAIKVY